MEKGIDHNVTMQDAANMGAVKIADDVVAMIASLAATEVNGVFALAGNVTHELMSRVGMKHPGKGVKVDVLERNVTVELVLIMEYGYSIPVTCQKVQNKVKAAIESMTGLVCSDVNIRIAGIKMESKFSREKKGSTSKPHKNVKKSIEKLPRESRKVK